MFTPGSKYFLGLTGLSIVSAVLYMIFVNPNDLGAIALFGVAISGALIAGFTLLNRDGDVWSAQEATEASAPSVPASVWPITFALGLALVVLGMATQPIVFIIGVGVLVGAGIEWTIQDWADRASADAGYNSFARQRAIGALEYPGLAAIGAGAIAVLFSRIMLGVSKNAATLIFILVGIVILAVGVAAAYKPGFSGKNTIRATVVGALVLLIAGISFTATGERKELAKAEEEDHFSAVHRECGEEKGYFDKLANNKVSSRSGIAATIVLENGKLSAQLVGIPVKVESVTIARANSTSVLFRNKDSKDHRLVVNLGTQKVGTTDVVEELGTCTQLTGKNQENVLTLKIAKPAKAGEQYSFTVPGVTGEIQLVVP